MVAEAVPPAPTPRLVLASGSPRRRALLAMAGYDFEISIPDVVELREPNEAPEAMAVRLATTKATVVASEYSNAVVLGCDTIVVLGDKVLGKPSSVVDAVTMLLELAGRTHDVITGYALASAHGTDVDTGSEYSAVTMRPVSRGEAEAYAASGEPLDKAGAYALQGDGGRFVAGVAGSRSNVIGLPLEPIRLLLERHGVRSAGG